MTACDACLRRGWLVGRMSLHLEQVRADRRHVREVLALADADLIAAIGGTLQPDLEAEYEAFDAAADRAHVQVAGQTAVCRHEQGYPPRLEDLPDPPAVLYVAGDAAAFASMAARADAPPMVAVVGSRRSGPDGRAAARRLGRDLSLAGVPVVSGMAMGVDASAHRGALEGGGRTVAVLGCGPDVVYPRTEHRLHADLTAAAAVVSELPPGLPVRRWAFPARNRIIAALAQLTVVVEAAERSGSLITAELAQDLGRDVGAMPGRAGHAGARGSNGLLRDGCAVIRDAQDALDELFGVGVRHQLPSVGPDVGLLSPALRGLLREVRAGRATVPALCASADDVPRITAGLGELELLGHVARTGEGRYVAVV